MTDTTTTITKTVFLDASRETVWSFLTNKDKLAKWFHPAKSDLASGEDYSLIRTTDDGASVPIIWGRVLDMDAPSKLVYTFIIDPFDGAETTVTWILDDAAGGTRLTLIHEGIAKAAGAASMQLLMALDHGWDEHLDHLRKSIAS
ncbi:MAG: SRPBCC domain-containing protein [Alphaproteobacteria bacterium]|nr:SRPBCC domain-containing protein [Alphaproteobacteria bacterium]